MSVRFVLGRAGVGKTRHCLDAVAQRLARADDDARLIMLVPEQASLMTERALARLAPGGGFWRAEVVSFSRLALRLGDQLAGAPTILQAHQRALALRTIVARDPHLIEPFGRAAAAQGFFAELSAALRQLLLDGVAPSAFAAATERINGPAQPRLLALAGLFAAYHQWLGPHRLDSAAQLGWIRERLDELPWLSDAAIWVDGFAEFAGLEFELLVALLARTRAATITLLLDPAEIDPQAPALRDDPLRRFHPTERTYARLFAALTRRGVQMAEPLCLAPDTPPRFRHAAGLAQLERDAFRGAPRTGHSTTNASAAGPGQASAGVDVRECLTPRDELIAAARQIRRAVVDSRGRTRFRDFALITRDVGRLAPLIAGVFADYEIPVFLDRRRPLGAHPLVRFVDGLLSAATRDAPPETMRQLLGTRLMPADADVVDELQELIRLGAPRGWAAWRAAAWRFAELRGVEETPAARALREHIATAAEPLASAANREELTIAEAATALDMSLERLQARAALTAWMDQARGESDWNTAETHRLAWEALVDALEEMCALLGDVRLPLDSFAGLLRATLRERTLGLTPPTLDQVLVASIERSRHPDIKHAWVLGFNDGVFPAPTPQRPLLSAQDRLELTDAGIALAERANQDNFAERLLAYIAVTRPSRTLTISYALRDMDGTEMRPSPLLAEIDAVLPNAARQAAASGAAADGPLTTRELAARLLLRRETLEDAVAAVRRRDPRLGERLAACLRGAAYRNQSASAPPPAAAAGEPAWRGSVSEIETWLHCPFQHFVNHRLHLRSRDEEYAASRALGSRAHEVLDALTRRVIDADRSVQDMSDGEWIALLDEVLRADGMRVESELVKRRPLTRLLADAQVEALRNLVIAHGARWRAGGFRPILSEVWFGGREDGSGKAGWPPLRLPLDDGRTVALRGKIDRIDVHDAANARLLLIYDYKPSVEPFHNRGYALGLSLQLFTYALAVRQNLATLAAPGARPATIAGVLASPVYIKTDELGKLAPDDDLDERARMCLVRPAGGFLDEVGCAADPCAAQPGGDSAVLLFKTKKNGGRHSASQCVSLPEFDAWFDVASRTIVQAATGIVAGDASIRPMLKDQALACRQCAYRAVCRFEQELNPPRTVDDLPRRAAVEGEGAP